MINELKKILNEANDNDFDAPYNREDDKTAPKLGQTRKKILRLCDVNRLKHIRNQQREEIAQDSVFIPILYANPSPDEGMGGGLGMM